MEILEGLPLLSISDSYLRSEALVLMADLLTVSKQDSKSQAEMVNHPELYLRAHASLLTQVQLIQAYKCILHDCIFIILLFIL